MMMGIEHDVFEHPWTEKEFLEALKGRTCVCCVVEHPKTQAIIGYVVYQLLAKQIRILNFAVHRAHWRKGIGRKLMSKMIEKIAKGVREKITIAVRETNLIGHLFLKATGFKAVAVTPHYWSDCDEDGYEFVLDLKTLEAVLP